MPNQKTCSSLKEYLELESREMLEGDNAWFAGIANGHPPTREECARHYTQHGGPEDFRRRYYVATPTPTPTPIPTTDSDPANR